MKFLFRFLIFLHVIFAVIQFVVSATVPLQSNSIIKLHKSLAKDSRIRVSFQLEEVGDSNSAAATTNENGAVLSGRSVPVSRPETQTVENVYHNGSISSVSKTVVNDGGVVYDNRIPQENSGIVSSSSVVKTNEGHQIRNFRSASLQNVNLKTKNYRDIISGDILFSDANKIKLVDDVMYEVYGNMVPLKDEEIVLAGSNSSTEGADETEGTEAGVETVVDIVFNHRLVETGFENKKAYLAYLKEYMTKLTEKLQKTQPDQVDVFKTNINKVMKDILGRFPDLLFFTGESMDRDGIVAIMEYRDTDAGSIPIFYVIKHGLKEETV